MGVWRYKKSLAKASFFSCCMGAQVSCCRSSARRHDEVFFEKNGKRKQALLSNTFFPLPFVLPHQEESSAGSVDGKHRSLESSDCKNQRSSSPRFFRASLLPCLPQSSLPAVEWRLSSPQDRLGKKEKTEKLKKTKE